jgi:rhamnulokinase
MTAKHTYLAFDLGAESGRAILGRLAESRLVIEEIHRFPNEPVHSNGSLHWDVLRLWHEMQAALRSVGEHNVEQLDGIGVDTWGVDFALLGENGTLLENPFHYRDKRHDGVMERVCARLGAEFIYRITGIQFLPFNSLYQLVAAAERTPRLLEYAQHLVMMPDLFHFWLTGKVACEYTNASTTQFLDVHTRQWSREILQRLELPTHMLVPIVEAGTPLGGLRPELAAGQSALSGATVIAPACHDTGSAFAAVQSGGGTALISSGTWSLLGMETASPVVSGEALRLNFTNEGGVCGTVRLLKNITGMWLLERCRRAWQGRGADYTYPQLLVMAASEKPLQHLIDPDDRSFAMPPDMPAAIDLFCEKTGQGRPATAGAYTRTVLESLALKYRYVLESLESLTGTNCREIRVVGGGSQNDLLNQLIADATGCRVLAGPAEATALGNVAMQMVGSGGVKSLAEAREIITRSFHTRVFEPRGNNAWENAYRRFRTITARLNSA